MIRLKLFATLLLCSVLSLQALSPLRQINPHNPEKDLESYIEKRKAEDVYITLPKNYTPIDVRGKSDIRYSIGNGSFGGGVDWGYAKKDIYAIIEDDSCRAAICFPESYLDFILDMNRMMKENGHEANIDNNIYENSISKVLRNSKSIEADLRMIYNDEYLDIRPLITVIAEEDMSRYANADTAVIYEWDMISKSFMEAYRYGIGIYLMKKAHPAQHIRLMLNGSSIKEKEKYIRDVLDNIHFGDNPGEAFVKAEEEVSNISDLNFPTKYRVTTGILPSYNDDVLEEVTRVKAWCAAHGIKELPKIDDELLEILNKGKERRQRQKAHADSILNSDIPDDRKILSRFMLDSQPHFPGDDNLSNHTAYYDWVDSNIRYPKEAIKKSIEKQRVVIDFVVCADGTIKDASVSHWDKDADECFKKEALRLVNSMPRWVPAMYNGKAVNAYTECTIWFMLDPKTKKQKIRSQTDSQYLEKDRIYDPTTIQVAPKFEGDIE